MKIGTIRKNYAITLLVSFFGVLLVCRVLLGWKGMIEIAEMCYPQTIVGYVGIVIYAELVGFKLSNKLLRYRNGSLFMLSAFLFGCLIGSISTMVIYGDYDIYDYIYKPMFWLAFFGSIPALTIGLLFTKLLKKDWENQSVQTTSASARV
ncbi:hypothetical protein [Pelagicoccus albus]|uniref:Uncharacterized protein n=1 Tax=Pelagicoccus albus TaxID=415222 RepID=A0A7X1B616_9BACT|nr:hypothetical protein [Pelagicoccus albus]MBC2606316.1 hypothetical protein [Pelagicoccus albus]